MKDFHFFPATENPRVNKVNPFQTSYKITLPITYPIFTTTKDEIRFRNVVLIKFFADIAPKIMDKIFLQRRMMKQSKMGSWPSIDDESEISFKGISFKKSETVGSWLVSRTCCHLHTFPFEKQFARESLKCFQIEV